MRRLAAGAAITGAALCAVPALASASSSCTYGLGGPGGVSLTATIIDGSGSTPLKVVRAGPFIAVADGTATPRICTGPTGVQASVTNTDFINVIGGGTTGVDSYILDQSNGVFGPGATPESDGTSEIETIVGTNDQAATLIVRGTAGPDTMRVGDHGGVMLGSDLDTDVRLLRARLVVLNGKGGGDFLSGRGGSPAATPAGATSVVRMVGGDGDDTLVDGLNNGDSLEGDAGGDILFSADGHPDTVLGGAGFDRGTADVADAVDDDVEQQTLTTVGRLRMSPGVVRARHGRTARLRVSWTHPRSWRELREVEVGLYARGRSVGTVDVRRGHLAGHGAVALVAKGSRLGHHGRTVTARLALRVPKSLAGQYLRVDVRATDTRGREQVEPGAGLIRVR